MVGDQLVTADFQGYVHWLDKATGTLAARERSGKVRVSTAPVAAGDMVVVINDRGQISAWRVTPRAGAAAAKGAAVPPAPAKEAAPPAAPPAPQETPTSGTAPAPAPDTAPPPAETPPPPAPEASAPPPPQERR